ncbi:MAG TPA: 50S ribosomal protein L10 [Gammaproteobacteria bacterium]|nr:50S ribosomal protein L10 [Gammaproteobacteria bacterium]
MLTRAQKEAIVAEVAEVAGTAQSAVAAEYRGLTVGEMTRLRAEARNAGVYLRVVKNTLARRALEGTGYACMSDALVGPLVLAFSAEEPAAAARLVRDFSKEHDKLVAKVVALDGKLLAPGDLVALAEMPTRDEAISRLMAVMKAPIEKLARTIKAPTDKFVRTVAAVRDQKKAA